MRALPTGAVAALVVLAAACGGSPSEDADALPSDGSDAPVAGAPEGAFERSASEAAARALLGRGEDELELGPATRLVRRGDEEFPVTMDLRPGRRNVELDDDGSGTFVVSRVTVEVPDGEEPLVVEGLLAR